MRETQAGWVQGPAAATRDRGKEGIALSSLLFCFYDENFSLSLEFPRSRNGLPRA